MRTVGRVAVAHDSLMFMPQDLPWGDLLEVLPDGVALIDERGVIRQCNKILTALTGYAGNELVGKTVETLVPSQHRDGHIENRSKYARNTVTRRMGAGLDLTLLRRDGSELAVDIAVATLTIGDKPWVIVTIRDDTAQRTAAEALATAELRFRLAFEDHMAPMNFTDLEDKIINANHAFCQMIGRTEKEIVSSGLISFTHPEDVGISEEAHRRLVSGEVCNARYVKRYLHKDGRVITVEVSDSPTLDAKGKQLYFVNSQRDITRERALAAQLSYQALHDPLTGLANRVLFQDRLSQAHARIIRQGGLGAVLLLDLDDFKGVNDTHGHVAGDQLLVAIARRLEQVTRSSDTLCRFGGDEFLYLAEGLRSRDEAEQAATRLLDALVEPFSIAETQLEQHVSIGVVICDATSTDCSELIQDADVARYEAKRQGKSQFAVFTPDMHQLAVSRFVLIQELHRALESGEISMHYQPIVDLATTEVVGFEALMRWQHPERGWIPPNVFIPLAESNGIIMELGPFALREAITAAASWEGTSTRNGQLYVTVNLSARQFHDPHLVSMIAEALGTTGLGPERLVIEITESVALFNIAETMIVIEHLNHLGVALALDDFGTGFSSLSYLALLHPKIVKIDQSFISPSHQSGRNDALLEAIVSLGNKLEVIMLAEGIETEVQLERLRHLGCELGQGYLFSPAVPAGDVKAVLRRLPGNWE